MGAVFERDVDPGEIVVVEEGQVRSLRSNCTGGKGSMCIFEYIYFARPDSVIEGQSVHQARRLAGRALAREYPVEADIVIGVPDSGRDAALGYAEQAGIPYGEGLIKNRYIGRTFITPGQGAREDAVRLKLAALRSEVDGKRVVRSTTPSVRGTTCSQIIRLLRQAGARQVHMRVTAPPFYRPLLLRYRIPDRGEAHRLPPYRGGDRGDDRGRQPGLSQLGRPAHHRPGARCGFCDGCFTGRYPIEVT